MKAFAIARIDLKRLAVRPFAWTLAGLVVAMLAWRFLLDVAAFMHAPPAAAALGFGASAVGTLFLNLVQLGLVVVPLVTMQSLAGERGVQRLALLRTSGASATAIVLGKFVARLAYLWLLLLLVASMPLWLAQATTFDWGQFGAALLASALCLTALTAIGIACSAYAADPASAAAAAILIGAGLAVVDAGVRMSGAAPGWLGYLALQTHLLPALRGLLRSQDIFYFLLVTLFALVLAVHRLAGEAEHD